MLSIDTVRAAVTSPKPWSALDQLVRRQLAAGRLKNQIRGELIAMENEIHMTPEITEDSEDALHDIIDALAGMCAAKYAYENPPVLPTREELLQIPIWARIAFLGRCARRVLPLVYSGWPAINEDYAETFASCVTYAEKVGEYAERLPEYGEIEAAYMAYDHAENVVNMPEQLTRACSAICSAATYTQQHDDPNMKYDHLIGCITDAVAAAKEFGNLSRSIRDDYDSVQSKVGMLRITDEMGLAADAFGPLWPEGPPTGWPSMPGLPSRDTLSLEVVGPENAEELPLLQQIFNIYDSLNEYHISRGGQPLTLSDLQPFIPALVPVGM